MVSVVALIHRMVFVLYIVPLLVVSYQLASLSYGNAFREVDPPFLHIDTLPRCGGTQLRVER